MVASFSPPVTPTTPRELVLTPRDVAILGDLVKHRVLSSAWLTRAHFNGSQPACWERVRRLVGAGYVQKVETLPDEPKAYRATNKGKAALGLSTVGRPTRAVRPAQLLHTMAVADVAALLLARFGGAWISERELRDGAGGDWLRDGRGVQGRRYVPDGVLTVAAGDGVARLAAEVELSPKEPERYVGKLAWYRRLLVDGALTQVRWYAGSRTVAGLLERALERAGYVRGDEGMGVYDLHQVRAV
ncbi:MAG: replication-relaxation family protein [Chloroflexota bacterium]|nr:replication-relaxation family protein [Chloroflexota bacterium]